MSWMHKWIADLPVAQAVETLLTRCHQTAEPPDPNQPHDCVACKLAQYDTALKDSKAAVQSAIALKEDAAQLRQQVSVLSQTKSTLAEKLNAARAAVAQLETTAKAGVQTVTDAKTAAADWKQKAIDLQSQLNGEQFAHTLAKGRIQKIEAAIALLKG